MVSLRKLFKALYTQSNDKQDSLQELKNAFPVCSEVENERIIRENAMTGLFSLAQINTLISSPFLKQTQPTQPKVYLLFIWNSIVVLTSHRKREMLVEKHASVRKHKAFITDEFQIISVGDHEMFRGKKRLNFKQEGV